MTNRKRISRGRVGGRLELRAFSIAERISFMRCWYPRLSVATRWRSWEEYFSDYDAVKDELLADATTRSVYPGLVPFADRVRTDLEPNQVYDGHRHAALLHSHGYIRGDGHTHNFPPRGYPAVEIRGEAAD